MARIIEVKYVVKEQQKPEKGKKFLSAESIVPK